MYFLLSYSVSCPSSRLTAMGFRDATLDLPFTLLKSWLEIYFFQYKKADIIRPCIFYRLSFFYASTISITCALQRIIACCTSVVSIFSCEITCACLPFIAKLFGAIIAQCPQPMQPGWMTSCWVAVSFIVVIPWSFGVWIWVFVDVVCAGTDFVLWHPPRKLRIPQIPTMLAIFFRSFMVMVWCWVINMMRVYKSSLNET